ncbi:hypothetical protein LTR49_021460 [Elasticomyces elasticus]|nr:hypothetical protein LTR49_021460 [Elasticomyces elasticus]
MADFAFNASASNRASDRYDGRDYEIELAALPKTRAPYVSRNSTWNADDDADDISLIKHDRTRSKSGLSATERAVRVVSQTPTVASNRLKRRKLQGWKFGVTCSAWTAFSVLILNLILTIIAAAKFGSIEGVGTALEGSCDSVNSWTTWLHILINALSSILLSASNYTMQCLCSPTRKEIDEAHAKGDWMDIGVASVRNIWRIRWSRRIVWWCLALSSVPIHLLYNSAIFKTLDANEYTMAIVNPDFLTGGSDFNTLYETNYGYNTSIDSLSTLSYMQSFFANSSTDASLVQKLSNSDCIAAYGTGFVSGRNHVLAVTSKTSTAANHTVYGTDEAEYEFDGTGSGQPYFWICTDQPYRPGYNCDVPTARRNATNWTINNAKIDYCLSQIAPSHCKLQFSLHILITVILMNAGKAACMFLTLYRQREATLVTVGDALSSFLDRPDELTKGRCLMGKVDVSKGPLSWKAKGVKNTPNTNPLPITYYAPIRRRWFAGATVRRWCVTMGLCTGALITAAALLGVGTANTQAYLSGGSVFGLGFGAVDSRSLVNAGLPQSGSGGLVSAVLLANLPQAIVSFLYLTYNGLFTSMLLSHEYSKFAMDGRKKPLRVTTPHGQQRSTYYLQLPYTYSLPLLITSGTLHWLISQSIFLARISVYNDGVSSDQSDTSSVGYSCLPILLVILLGTAMLAFALSMGCRKFASHIPVAGSCSVAVSAACHPPKGDVDAGYLPVRWGEVKVQESDMGHSAFESGERLAISIMTSSTKDHWSAEKYSSAASFVPQLTTTVLSYLDVQPNDRVLDIGCGDGQISIQIATTASSGQVLGLDASQSFVSTASEKYASKNCTYKLQDCTRIDECSDAIDGSWDKVFSNAALHWILRNPDTRVAVFRDAHKALKSGGKLVFEMGGKGNVGEIQAAFISALSHAGLSIDKARAANPWFFPSVDWMSKTLSDVGFEVEKCELEYRPTKCNPETTDGSGGLVGWLRLMGAQFLEAVSEDKREAVLKEVSETLETVVTREEDGSKWLGYTRLRAVARKR